MFPKDSKRWISKDFMRFLNVSQYLVLYLLIRNIHIQSSFSYRCAQGGITYFALWEPKLLGEYFAHDSVILGLADVL